MFVCVYVCTYVRAHTWRLEHDIESLSLSLSLKWDLTVSAQWLASQGTPGIYLSLPVLGFQVGPWPCLAFGFLGYWGFKVRSS